MVMSGLDLKTLESLEIDKSIERILYDTKTDFIYSQHLNFVYKYASKELTELLLKKIKKYEFDFSLPLIIDVPKKSRLSRPGAILLPLDRLLYQILIDSMAPIIENNIDRGHVFSNVYINSPEMFENHSDSFKEFKEYIFKNTETYDYCLKMDVASYFESINQHILINLLSSLEIESQHVDLLEEALSSWSQKNSDSILQGLFGSDVLGNYFLSILDYVLKLKDYDYCRFVDDIYIFHDKEEVLYKLLVEVCSTLRTTGLFLNENKTQIKKCKDLHFEETEIDRMFDKIGQLLEELYEDCPELEEAHYGFQIEFYEEEEDTEPSEPTQIDGTAFFAIQELYGGRNDAKWKRDEIIKICMPLFSKTHSDFPLNDMEEEIIANPHLAKYYANYFASIISENADAEILLNKILLSDVLVYDHQVLWFLSALLYKKNQIPEIVDFAVKKITNKSTHETIRAICAILISKYGSGSQRRVLRDEYGVEPSIYVKSAIVYGTQYLKNDERHACKNAWGRHSDLNHLIIKAIANYNEQKNSPM